MLAGFKGVNTPLKVLLNVSPHPVVVLDVTVNDAKRD